MDLNNCLAN